MDKKILKHMENFRNIPDSSKFELLRELSELPRDEKILNFLVNVIENEKYDRIRINAVLMLKKFTNPIVIEKLKTIFTFEHDKSVRLVIVEVLGEKDSKEVEDFFQNVVLKDLNDVVRATAIRKLQERKKIDNSAMHALLLDVIQNDSSVFPKQIALSTFLCYADSSDYKTLKNLFIREEMLQMKKLLLNMIRVFV